MSNKEILTAMYFEHKDLITSIARKFVHKLPDEELEDLTQSCWERLVRDYSNYDSAVEEPVQWLIRTAKTEMYDMVKELSRIRSLIRSNSVSLDAMTDGKEKYL